MARSHVYRVLAFAEDVGTESGDIAKSWWMCARRALSPDHSRDVWLVGVDGWFGFWCGVGWLIGVCRGSGGAGGLVRGAWGRGCSTAGVRDWSGAPGQVRAATCR